LDILGTTRNINRNTNTKQNILKTEKYVDECEINIEECSICYEKHNTFEIAQILPCNHCFGKSCLLEWLNKKYLNTCPLC
jgi:hypothetical protein